MIGRKSDWRLSESGVLAQIEQSSTQFAHRTDAEFQLRNVLPR